MSHSPGDERKVWPPGLGTDLFGDNILGQAVDFFNPLSDLQEIADITDALTRHEAEEQTQEEVPKEKKQANCGTEKAKCESREAPENERERE